MNPDAYMPYYGSKFESALKGYPGHVKWSYLAACWHYWHHTHCQGLPNDDEYLFNICDCAHDQWQKVKSVIFSGPPFFHLGPDSKWHQKGCSSIYVESMLRYSSVIERSRMGVEARKRKKQQPQVEPEVEPQVNDRLDLGNYQSESESESDPKTCNKQTNGGFPTLQEVKEFASMQNIQESEAEKFWHHFESSGWIDKNGHPVVRWQSKLCVWRAQLQTDATKNGNGSGAAKLTIYSKELDRINEAIRKIVDGASRDAFGSAKYSDQEKDKLMKFKTRRKELQELLGVTI